jgi:hypothetical protein
VLNDACGHIPANNRTGQRVKWKGILPSDPFTLFNPQRVTHGRGQSIVPNRIKVPLPAGIGSQPIVVDRFVPGPDRPRNHHTAGSGGDSTGDKVGGGLGPLRPVLLSCEVYLKLWKIRPYLVVQKG